MKINSIVFKSLNLAALSQFFTRLLMIIKRIGADDLKITHLVNDLLVPASEKLDLAYKKSLGSIHTDKIAEIAKLMDDGTSGMMAMVAGMTKSYDKIVAEAAKRVKDFFSEYKGLVKKTRDEQCADTKNMIQGLRKLHSADVETLGLAGWIDKLEDLTDEMVELKDSRIVEKSEKGKNSSSTAKRDIVKAYRAICKQIEVNVLVDGLKNYDDFIRNLNALVTETIGASANPPKESDNASKENEKPSDEGEKTQELPPVEPEKYPNAKEWTPNYNPNDWKNGDIGYVFVEDKKVYYELIDQKSIDVPPTHEEYAGTWKKLD